MRLANSGRAFLFERLFAGKEDNMTKKEAMKVIAEASCEIACPLVDEIAKRAAYEFELASETVIENDEDDLIFDLMMRLYASGNAMEAVDVLMLTFSLVGMTEIAAVLDVIAVSGRDEVYELFMRCFTEHSERCEVHHILMEDLPEELLN